MNANKLTDRLLKKYYWLIYNEKSIKLELEIRMLDKKKLIYQMELLNHFKKYSNINLELFDMVPDLPTVYSEVNNSSPDTSKCFDNESNTSQDDLNGRDSLDDLINMNNNNNNMNLNNNNSRRHSASNEVSVDEDDEDNDENSHKLIDQAVSDRPNDSELFNLKAIKWHIDTTCLKIFGYIMVFLSYLQQELSQLNQKEKIAFVKK